MSALQSLHDWNRARLRFVTNCMVLTEGFDMPDIGCAILARSTKKMGLFRQMIGRVLRPADGKPDAIVLDHSGAVFCPRITSSGRSIAKSMQPPPSIRGGSGRASIRGCSNARSAAPCAWAASRARLAGLCRGALRNSSRLQPTSSALSSAARRRSTMARLRRFSGMLCLPASQPSAATNPDGSPTNSGKNLATGPKAAPSTRSSQRLKCSPGYARATSHTQKPNNGMRREAQSHRRPYGSDAAPCRRTWFRRRRAAAELGTSPYPINPTLKRVAQVRTQSTVSGLPTDLCQASREKKEAVRAGACPTDTARTATTASVERMKLLH